MAAYSVSVLFNKTLFHPTPVALFGNYVLCNETLFDPIDVEVFSVVGLINTMFLHPMGLVVFTVAVLFNTSFYHQRQWLYRCFCLVQRNPSVLHMWQSGCVMQQHACPSHRCGSVWYVFLCYATKHFSTP